MTSIGNCTFYNCSSLTSVTIGDNVTSIGGSAFYGCTSLTSITIPDNVTSIGTYAFYNCTSLENVYVIDLEAWCNITFGDVYANPMYYVENLYLNGEKLTGDIVLSSNVISIPYGTFKNSTITDITIPYSVTSIGSYAFYGCTLLTKINSDIDGEFIIPDSVTSIGSSAFGGCSSLISITLPFVGSSATATSASASTLFGYIFGTSSYDGGTSIKQYYASSSYTTYYIPATLTMVTITGENILYGAFYNCASLISVTIGSSVTSIGSYAFYNCTSLTNVIIGDSVTSIGSYAFYNCTALTSLNYTGTASLWASISFGNLTANPLYYANNLYLNGTLAKDITLASITSINAYAFYACTSLTSVTIGESVTSIGSYAFYNCTSLASVTIGSGVTTIGNRAFYGCKALTEINFNATAMNDLSEDNYVFYSAGKYAGGITVTVGANVTSIPAYLFYPSSSSGIYFPKITSVVFETDSVCTSIGSYAFYCCEALTSVTLGANITTIDSYAFTACSKLVEIYNFSSLNIVAGSTSYGNIARYAKNIYTSATDESNLISDGDYLYLIDDNIYYLIAYTGTETDIILPDNIYGNTYSIYNYAFYGCFFLKSVTISDGVMSIGNYAFSYCFSLSSVTIGGNVAAIGDGAFRNCTSITSITVPESVTSLGSSVFYNCTALTSVTIGSNVTSIGTYAFYYCTALTSVTIGSSVTSIGNYAFNYCTALESITIPSSVTSIGAYAFYNCDSLTSVTFEKTSGWYYTTTEGASSGTSFTSSKLSTASIAAGYLTYSYHTCYWYRSV